MSVYDDARAGKYALPEMLHVEPPAMDAETTTIAEAKRLHNAHRDAKRAARVAYREAQYAITDQVRKDLEAEHGLTGHPKAGAVWEMAWERGHSSGYAEVALEYEKLVEIVK